MGNDIQSAGYVDEQKYTTLLQNQHQLFGFITVMKPRKGANRLYMSL
jgi:hypothetical protein